MVRASMKIEGLEAASRKLTEELNRVGKDTSHKFVVLALKSIEAAASPYVPVASSLLINSAYSTVRQAMGSTAMPGYEGEFGYGANYAGYVHEGGPKNWQKAGASDAFLAKGVDDFINETLDDLLGMIGD